MALLLLVLHWLAPPLHLRFLPLALLHGFARLLALQLPMQLCKKARLKINMFLLTAARNTEGI